MTSFECSEDDVDESAGQAELCVICGKRIEPAARYFTSAGLPRHMLCERTAADDAAAFYAGKKFDRENDLSFD